MENTGNKNSESTHTHTHTHTQTHTHRQAWWSMHMSVVHYTYISSIWALARVGNYAIFASFLVVGK